MSARKTLALVSYVLILESIVETIVRGSPVRWWAAGIGAVYAVATVVGRRRTSWSGRTIASWLVLFGMLGLTAWLPDGLENGVRLLGLSTSTLLSLAAAAGVTVGAYVLLRSVRLPAMGQALVVAMAAYGVAAFLAAAATDTPFASLLSGESFWRTLPVLLQGAVVGGLIVLPAALMAAVVRLGTRQPSQGSLEHGFYRTAALITTLSIVVAALPQRRSDASIRAVLPPAPESHSAALDDPAAARRLAILDNSLRAIEDGDRDSPRDRWDPAYIVEQVGNDPKALIAWVRDNTFWVPYRGMLRGPVGVLMDRQGNSLDRAILLATLLQGAGHTVRLAHGEISKKQALDLLPDLVLRHSVRTTLLDAALDPEPDVRMIAAQYHLDGEVIARRLDAQEESVAQLVLELEGRVADQGNRLLSMVASPDGDVEWRSRYRSALEALQDHWWVQRGEGGQWTDLDVLAPAGTTSKLVTAQETMAPSAVPADLRHEVGVRVVLEHWSAGGLAESRVLEHVLRPSELFGQPVVLQLWPGSWPRELHPDPNSQFGLRAAALVQREWTIALIVGRDVVAQTVIRDTADTSAAPGGGNPFGGLRGAMTGLSRQSQASNARVQELTAAWIEYEIRAPGGPRRVRRNVFDLVGTATRSDGSISQLALTEAQRLTRSLALMMRTEILAAACELAPEFVTHLAARSLVGNREVLRALARNDVEPGEPATEKLLSDAAPAVTPLYGLVLARTEWSRTRDRLYADRVGIFTRHRYPAFSGQDLVLRDATDIVANEWGVTLAERDAFAIRLQQGVLDTNAEALLYSSPRGLANTADAFNVSQSWVALTPDQMDGARSLDLPADAQRAIAQELERGYVVIVPHTAVPIGSESYVGWWRIDPTTGDALGVAANGWGQAMAERGVQYNALVEMAKTFAFEYAFCQAVPQVANQAVAFLQPYRNELPPWLPPLAQAQDPGAVYQANTKGCLIGAMIGTGVTATLPLLLMTLRGYAARLASRLGPFMRDQRGGIRYPPGWVKGPVRGEPAVPSGQSANPPAKPEVNPFAQTQSGPPVPKTGSGGSTGTPAAGRPGAGGGGHDYPQPFKPGKAPAGQGPFQGDAELREWLKDNADHPLSQMLGGRASYGPGGTSGLYGQADAAATSAYNAARSAGQSADAARQASYEAYWEYLKQGRGDYAIPLPSGGVKFKKGPGTMKMEAGSAGLSGGPGDPP